MTATITTRLCFTCLLYTSTVSVRTRTGEDLGAMSLADFAAKLHEIVDSKARQ